MQEQGRTILFCFAHPDDESFSSAGTAMRYAAQGVRTVLVTATRGERGKTGDPPICTEAELPAVREGELRKAASIIGFDALHLLEYRDRELANADPAEVRHKLVSIIRRERPAIVLTFDPNGFNVHPDHVAISRFTSEAISASADARWHPETGAPHQVGRLLWIAPLAPWDVEPQNAPLTPGIDFVLAVSEWRERRIAALRAHRTQHLSIDRFFFSRSDVNRVLAVEYWRHAWGPPLQSRPSGDIFDSLP